MKPKVGDVVIRTYSINHRDIAKGDICEILDIIEEFGHWMIKVKRLSDNYIAEEAMYSRFKPHILIEYEDVI